MDYDIEAVANAKATDRSAAPEAVCGGCGKPIYRGQPYPGVATEWSHRSSGQPVSWMPVKHLAAFIKVTPHGHRFAASTTEAVACTVSGCTAEMEPIDRESLRLAAKEQKKRTQTAKEAAMEESRARGVEQSQFRRAQSF